MAKKSLGMFTVCYDEYSPQMIMFLVDYASNVLGLEYPNYVEFGYL